MGRKKIIDLSFLDRIEQYYSIYYIYIICSVSMQKNINSFCLREYNKIDNRNTEEDTCLPQ